MGILEEYVTSFIGVYITLIVVLLVITYLYCIHVNRRLMKMHLSQERYERYTRHKEHQKSYKERHTSGEQIINMSQIKVVHESDWIPDSGNGSQSDGKVNESQSPIGVSNV